MPIFSGHDEDGCDICDGYETGLCIYCPKKYQPRLRCVITSTPLLLIESILLEMIEMPAYNMIQSEELDLMLELKDTLIQLHSISGYRGIRGRAMRLCRMINSTSIHVLVVPVPTTISLILGLL